METERRAKQRNERRHRMIRLINWMIMGLAGHVARSGHSSSSCKVYVLMLEQRNIQTDIREAGEGESGVGPSGTGKGPLAVFFFLFVCLFLHFCSGDVKVSW